MANRRRSGADNAAEAYLPPFYPDELVYSYAARYKHHRSLPAYAANLQLFNRELSAAVGLPNRLQQLASHFRDPTVTADYIAWSHTLLPYLTAFHSPAQRLRTVAAMTGDHEIASSVGGTGYSPFRTPDRLRFCTLCQEQMLDSRGELYWRRAHQLPVATMCPNHGIPLRLSAVAIEKPQRSCHHATMENCPADAPSMLDGCADPDMGALTELSIEAHLLLTKGDRLIDRRSAVDELLSMLRNKGYCGPTGHMAWDKLRSTVDHALAAIALVYPEVTASTPGYSVPSWLARLRHGSSRPIPATVLLARRVAAAAPVLASPFGSGPWECRNPASDHRGALTINKISRQSVYGDGYRALFECPCGYAYTRLSHSDGSVGEARFSRFGPSLKDVIRGAREQGTSLWVTAESVGLQVVALLNAMEKEDIPIHWTNLPRAYRDGAAKRKARAGTSTKRGRRRCETEAGQSKPNWK